MYEGQIKRGLSEGRCNERAMEFRARSLYLPPPLFDLSTPGPECAQEGEPGAESDWLSDGPLSLVFGFCRSLSRPPLLASPSMLSLSDSGDRDRDMERERERELCRSERGVRERRNVLSRVASAWSRSWLLRAPFPGRLRSPDSREDSLLEE